MNFELGENKYCELNERDLVMIFGGGPDRNTGFWYDAAYYITTFVIGMVKYSETHSPVPRGQVY
jgi:hypothetical protein